MRLPVLLNTFWVFRKWILNYSQVWSWWSNWFHLFNAVEYTHACWINKYPMLIFYCSVIGALSNLVIVARSSISVNRVSTSSLGGKVIVSTWVVSCLSSWGVTFPNISNNYSKISGINWTILLVTEFRRAFKNFGSIAATICWIRACSTPRHSWNIRSASSC